MQKIRNKKVVVIFLVTVGAALLSWLWEVSTNRREEVILYRNGPGEGDKTEELEVSVEGILKRTPLQIEIAEQKYSEDEIEKIFEEKVKELEVIVLAENESLEHIASNLNLVTAIPDSAISVEWNMDRHDLLTLTGELQEENLNEEGQPVELRALLKYGDTEIFHIFNGIVYAPELNAETALKKKIKELTEVINKDNRETLIFQLPDQINGKKITWSRTNGQIKYAFLLIGGAAIGYLLVAAKQTERKRIKSREQQLLIDYPEILNKLVLFLGAGMTVKGAWLNIVTDYEKQAGSKRFAYEEMRHTSRELRSNIGECDCYERFGKRCQIQEYVRLGAILARNLQKGNADLTKLLTAEVKNAFEERKNRARRLGEEASTKLLLPMFLMLTVVLVIIVVPSFLSFQL